VNGRPILRLRIRVASLRTLPNVKLERISWIGGAGRAFFRNAITFLPTESFRLRTDGLPPSQFLLEQQPGFLTA
jgi:hypothetical protein